MRPLATHRLIELHDCDAGVLADPHRVEAALVLAARAFEQDVLQRHARPRGEGVSSMVVTADAHLALYTWPERRYAALDAFELVPGTITRAVECLRAELRAGRVEPGEAAPLVAEANVEPPYTPRHPALFTYDAAFVERFIDPGVRRVERGVRPSPHVVREVAEQLYHFRLFTPELCRLLIEEVEHRAAWITVLEKTVEAHGEFEGVGDVCDPDTTTSFERLPGLEAVYGQVIRAHVQPLVETLWTTYRLQRWDTPAVRKYEPHVVRGMDLHHDAETVGMVGYLSAGFEGGGTHFPRWDVTVGAASDVVVGSVVVYPGGVSHEHLAWPITAGVRYTLANSFY